MLHHEAIEPGTLALLNELMQVPELLPFSLVGGTALALRYGHRRSVDIDLFCHEPVDHEAILRAITRKFPEEIRYETGFGNTAIFAVIKGVKVDILHYPHPRISELVISGPIRMYGDPDIAAMKIQAILGRGRKKDFWDLYELLQHYPLGQIAEWHGQKYPNQMLAISIPVAILYFRDADESETPDSLRNLTWEKIKKGIASSVREYLR